MGQEAKALNSETANTKSLFKNQDFLLVWTVSIVSSLSFSIYLITETWYVINELNKQSWLGVVLIATTLPRVLLIGFGGVYADRFNKINIMFLSLLLRGVLLILVSIFFYFNILNVYSLVVFAALFGCIDAFFNPANQSLLPQIIAKDKLLRGNSIFQSTNQTVLILGPIIGGILIEKISYEFIFPIVAICLILSSIMIKFAKIKKGSSTEHKIKQSSFRDFMEGVNYVKTSTIIFTLMGVSIILNFFIAGPGSLALPLIANDVLEGTAIHLSFLEGSIALGMIIGAIIIGAINPKRKRGLIILGQLLFLGITMLLLSSVTTLWQGILYFIILGFGISAGDIPLKAILQEGTEPEKIGRVMGIMSTASNGLIPLSFGLTSVAISYNISISNILLFFGSCVLVFFFIIISTVKKLRVFE